jgi:deoxyguanosine kinase
VSDLLSRFRHIAIEGTIGVGKSSLARRLASHWGAELLLERADENPFLDRYYADPRAYAFQAQLFFLFQRVKQMQHLAQPGMFTRGIVSDFMFAKDKLFAQLTLDDEEFRLYGQIHSHVARDLVRPDLVIWLKASPETLLRRIARRGIAMERRISSDYLQGLSEGYARHFESEPPASMLVVVTDAFNPVENEGDFALLLARLDALDTGMSVLDPTPGAPLA